MKRAFDIACVLLAAPLWVPVAACVALAVFLFEGRPVFFVQERTGRGGRPFNMVKFRTMRTGNGGDGERLTRFGRFLRASSLDEIPELVHVLSGRMSLVGPRPLPVRYMERYSAVQRRRHEVRPGITGWAQVHGRNTVSWEDKFAMDVWYVDHASFILDLKILFMTAAGVLSASGVNAPGSDTMGEFEGNSNLECRNEKGEMPCQSQIVDTPSA